VERGGRADPFVVEAEPDAIDELERRAPDTAHLTADVPAVRVEATVLEAFDVGAVAGRDLAAILQALVGGRLGRRRAGGRGEEQGGGQHRRRDPPYEHCPSAGAP
jgi:hypothetical protein